MNADRYRSLMFGDMLETAARLPKRAFRLVYLDPPFLTGRERVGTGRNGGIRMHGQAGSRPIFPGCVTVWKRFSRFSRRPGAWCCTWTFILFTIQR